jgi:hypothetical protein
VQDKLIAGLIGVVTGFLGALLKTWLDSRLLLDTETRKERWTVYKALWSSMQAVPKWPRNRELTNGKLLDFSGACRDWYFSTGGFYLSRSAQRAYGRMQQAITDVTQAKDNAAPVDDPEYDRVQEACSALRTQLTRDLLSRQRGALHYFGI